jgi:hypothetical protein
MLPQSDLAQTFAYSGFAATVSGGGYCVSSLVAFGKRIPAVPLCGPFPIPPLVVLELRLIA